MEKCLNINENTKIYANINGKIMFIKNTLNIDELCKKIINSYKENKEKYVIYCIQKDDYVFFINSHFKSKTDFKKSKRSLQKDGFVVMTYNG